MSEVSGNPVIDGASVEAIAARVAEIVRQPPEPLMTVDEVAEMLRVRVEWVYAHADDLGVYRLGSGTRGRLRFDRHRVLGALAAPSTRAKARVARRPRRASVPAGNLLPIGRKR